MATAKDTQVTKTIAEQLGGYGRLRAMAGAHNFVAYTDGGFKFQFKGCEKANICKITLDADDTYTVKFFKFSPRKLTCDEVESHEGIYCDMLRDLFTATTGLYLSL